MGRISNDLASGLTPQPAPVSREEFYAGRVSRAATAAPEASAEFEEQIDPGATRSFRPQPPVLNAGGERE